MAESGKVLFVPFAKGSMLETLPVARALVAGHGPTPLYYLDPKHAPATVPVLAGEGFWAFGPEGDAFLPSKDAAAAQDGGAKRPRKKKSWRLLSRLFGFARSLRHDRRLVRRARSILARHPEIRALL